ncbi:MULTISPECIES: cytochrome o ubiquinol oxidase subunit IV [Ochrobactrum]|jgi:cytochrome o ubiquinol oxidase operon protein cyoD|uniref:Cytochrome bo(3) ubiquinol oxidase subunit 4 n=1 Tax=Ochrobactrum quorumnocens TaxID=271865 RepID=A0A248UF18_9HYPH|nr:MULTISPECIES: cytochrome o ubiquinol oxidase subunit IV [Brucella/Ochrobactrum group]MBD7992497.1 cytochrome o ubiquinol oxidase subunit IV [Ochrobactrum gallinarum]ASV85427.1 cytochrome o ubiquinol oxidase subunit IV [[Ochrobactrum] quorumnocens]KAA9366609.1 cytochrome o ubiquinol oxidase subunit IV [[Ochrobactrum] quorumnocens]MCV9906333.1 cytochrome o ubiquinol oxidase subunit IV [Brucella sp. HL-2]MDH7790078.1 cytochrome o ubiquinol oxidase operon protein cyoD [Ochrobactrum sp. AN78]
MSSGHETHDQAAHGSLKSYLIGLALAIILTIVPFMLAMNGYFTPATTAAIVIGMAAVQIVVHLVYFLHLDPKSENGWNILALIFTVIILAIVLAGSIWVMHHLDTNMMPMYMTPDDARNLP